MDRSRGRGHHDGHQLIEGGALRGDEPVEAVGEIASGEAVGDRDAGCLDIG
jgi:hypothetical protein